MKKTYLTLSSNSVEFHSIALKFRNLLCRIDSLLSSGKFWEFSKSQQDRLLSKLRSLFEKLSGFDFKYAMKIAGAALCFSLIGGSAKAAPTFSNFNPNNPFPFSTLFGNTFSGETVFDGAFADIDGDYDLDAILLTYCGAAYFENVNGVFTENEAENPFYGVFCSDSYYVPATGIDMADFDGDEKLDAILAGSPIKHYQLVGGKFEYANSGSSGSWLNSQSGCGTSICAEKCKFGDVDNDGDLDIVGTICCGATVLSLLQDASHQFSRNWCLPYNGQIAPFGSDVHINLADMDGDGDDDLFVFIRPNLGSPVPLTVPSSGSTNPSYYQNNFPATGPFSLITSNVPLPLAYMSSQYFPLLADLDGDGDFDVFTPGGSGDYNFRNGSGSASAVPIPPLVALLVFAATGFGIFRRNRKKKTE